MVPYSYRFLLLATVLVPMDFGKWTPTPIRSYPLPLVEASSREWKITTQSSAGGFGFLLDQPIQAVPEALVATWDWRVLVFPQAKPATPFSKKEDDYPLRVGVLLSDGSSRINVPGKLGKRLREKKIDLSTILFYGAVRVKDFQQAAPCASSPYARHILICPKLVGNQNQSEEVFPLLDLQKSVAMEPSRFKKIKVVGFWIFADSDNSRSSSSSRLSNLKFLLR